jgi:hypothetical protein
MEEQQQCDCGPKAGSSVFLVAVVLVAQDCPDYHTISSDEQTPCLWQLAVCGALSLLGRAFSLCALLPLRLYVPALFVLLLLLAVLNCIVFGVVLFRHLSPIAAEDPGEVRLMVPRVGVEEWTADALPC